MIWYPVKGTLTKGSVFASKDGLCDYDHMACKYFGKLLSLNIPLLHPESNDYRKTKIAIAVQSFFFFLKSSKKKFVKDSLCCFFTLP